jgi:peptidyl-prolyl cis-trans isomerase B (cyclophilin B)
MFGIKAAAMGLMVAAGLFAAGNAFAVDAPAKATTPAPAKAAAGDEVAILETSKGRMVVEFWEKDAPKTVANFKKLARQAFFDGTGFHRIIKDFMIQGGDPKSKNPKAPDLGTGDPGYKIQDEFSSRPHIKGVLSMANSGTPNSAGSQFFIMTAAAQHLDGHYTAFGRLVQGMDVLDAIRMVPVGPNAMMGGEKSKPLEWVTLKSVKIVPRASLASSAGKPSARKAGASPPAAVTTKPAASKSAPRPKTTETKAVDAQESEEAKAAPAGEPAKEPAKETPTQEAVPDSGSKSGS